MQPDAVHWGNVKPNHAFVKPPTMKDETDGLMFHHC